MHSNQVNSIRLDSADLTQTSCRVVKRIRGYELLLLFAFGKALESATAYIGISVCIIRIPFQQPRCCLETAASIFLTHFIGKI